MKTWEEVLRIAQERMKTLTFESYQEFAEKKQAADKTLNYNDDEMQETVYENHCS